MVCSSVDNPNYFSVDIQQIQAEVSILWTTILASHFPSQIIYPINNTNVGQGLLNNVVIHSNAQTNLTFPFSLDYITSVDPQHLILVDLAQKCGLVGSKSNISVKYKITVRWQLWSDWQALRHSWCSLQIKLLILIVPISPVISNSFDFACPISASDLSVWLLDALWCSSLTMWL